MDSDLDTDQIYHLKNGNLSKKNEKKMLGIKFIDKIQNLEIREKTKTNDILEEVTKLKWK